jgi:hypothetical protein
MFRGGNDLPHVRARTVGLVALHQGAMDDQVGVAPNRTREVSVIVLRETEVAQRLRRVAGPLQTLQKSDLERLFLRLASE